MSKQTVVAILWTAVLLVPLVLLLRLMGGFPN